MSQPLISVITVTLNAVKFLEQCIQSVVEQHYPNVEHIIIDGGSTDGTIELLEKFDDKISYWKSEPDNGIYSAMNEALKHAKGEWILFLGADDVLLPGFDEMATILIDKNCIYYGESKWKDTIHGGPFNAYRLARFNICHQSIFYPKSVFNYYTYKIEYVIKADYYLNILCFTDSRFRFQFHKILVSTYAEGGISSTSPDPAFLHDRDNIIKSRFSKLVYYRYKLRQFRHFLKGKQYD